jgi:hypothetical protein
MATKRLKRPRDPIQLGKLIGDILTGQVEDEREDEPKKGRAGGLKGGAARSVSLDPQKRREIAQKAANARWAKKRQ